MQKIMNGYCSLNDSYKPLALAQELGVTAALAFGKEEIIIRPNRGAKLLDAEGFEVDSLSFRIVRASKAEAPVVQPPVLAAEAVEDLIMTEAAEAPELD